MIIIETMGKFDDVVIRAIPSLLQVWIKPEYYRVWSIVRGSDNMMGKPFLRVMATDSSMLRDTCICLAYDGFDVFSVGDENTWLSYLYTFDEIACEIGEIISGERQRQIVRNVMRAGIMGHQKSPEAAIQTLRIMIAGGALELGEDIKLDECSDQVHIYVHDNDSPENLKKRQIRWLQMLEMLSPTPSKLSCG